MKLWKVVGLLCLWTFTMSTGVSLGASDPMAGRDWNQLTHPEKTAYVSGYLDAMRAARQREGSPGLEVPGSTVKIPDLKDVEHAGRTDGNQLSDPEKTAYASGFKDAVPGARLHEGLKWLGVPVSNVVEGLNTYYADPKHTKLPVSLALVFLHGRVAGVESRAAQELMTN